MLLEVVRLGPRRKVPHLAVIAVIRQEQFGSDHPTGYPQSVCVQSRYTMPDQQDLAVEDPDEAVVDGRFMADWEPKAAEDILGAPAADDVVDGLPRMQIRVLFEEVVLAAIAFVVWYSM